jgi:hypothetical protein
MIKDPAVQTYIRGLFEGFTKDIKLGGLWIKGSYKFLIPDLEAFMQHAGKLDVIGCLQASEMYAKDLKARKIALYSFYNEIIEDDDDLSLDAQIETRKTILSTNSVIDELSRDLYFNPETSLDNYFQSTTKETVSEAKAKEDVTKSIGFKNWFGDWTIERTQLFNDYSTITYSDTPKIVYHGTRSPFPFSKFSFSKFPVMYFAENKEYAKWFADMGKGIMYSCYLKIMFPLNAFRFGIKPVKWLEVVIFLETKGVKVPANLWKDSLELTFWQFIRNDSPNFTLINAIKEAGYDGIIQEEDNPSAKDASGNYLQTKAYMIFNPNQVKVISSVEYTNNYNNIMYLKNGGQIPEEKIQKKLTIKNKLKSL